MAENQKTSFIHINQTDFLNWVERRIGSDYIVKGDEIMLNSIFKNNDQDHKLYCNCVKNLYHCWKTGQSGRLINLVQQIEGCSFKEALEICGGDLNFSWNDIQERVEEFWDRETAIKEDHKEINLELPPFTFPILDLPTGNPFRQEAEKYLNKRKIPLKGMQISTSGRLRGRLVIPYYARNNKLIYYNCRALNGEIPKYLGPPREQILVGKSEVVFMPKWFPEGTKIYLTEGEFDAITLLECGFPAAALGGKNLSENQLNILREFRLSFAADNDPAGIAALLVMGEMLSGRGIKTSYVLPPEGVKDWNELLQKYNPEIVKGYIEKMEKEFTETTIVELTEQFI